jgi:hypothetical protein
MTAIYILAGWRRNWGMFSLRADMRWASRLLVGKGFRQYIWHQGERLGGANVRRVLVLKSTKVRFGTYVGWKGVSFGESNVRRWGGPDFVLVTATEGWTKVIAWLSTFGGDEVKDGCRMKGGSGLRMSW